MNESNRVTNDKEPQSTSQLIEGAIRLGLLVGIATWCFLIVAPFILPVMWGAIIAVAIYPLFVKLKAAVGDNNKLAVIVYAVVALALLITPTIMVAGSIVDTTQDIIAQYEAGTLEINPPSEAVKDWPVVGEQLYAVWSDASVNLTATINDYQDQLHDLSDKARSSAASFGGTVGLFLISIIISSVMLAYSADAYAFSNRLLSRLTDDSKGETYTHMARDTIRSIAQGVLGIALIQAIFSGLGMWVMDVPAWGLWTLLVLVFAVVQLPALLVLGLVAVYVFSVAATTPAVLFTIYAVFVATSDMWLKPMLLGRGLDIPMPIILLGAIGGMLLNGVIGLFVGAVVLALGYELFMTWMAAGESNKPTED